MKKTVLAIDSFKGSLSSLEVAEAVERGILSVFADCEAVKIPMADGGEGTMEALVYATSGKTVTVNTFDPLMRPIKAAYGILGDGVTAVVELAAASGLPLLAVNERDPMKTTTFGTGVLIAHALKQGCRNFVLGIGGSATNDGGIGLLSALGFRFLDTEGKEVEPIGEKLSDIEHIDCDNIMKELSECSFRVACDVTNPLYGPNGAAYVYAPQKGASDETVKLLDKGLQHYASVIEKDIKIAVFSFSGAGAAGGTGAGLMAMLNATLLPGVELVLESLGFDKILDGCDLVITGEGRIDRQTAMGKAPAGVAAAARKKGIPVIAIAGAVEDREELGKAGFNACFSILPRVLTLNEAMRPETARENITQFITQLCRVIQLSKSI